MDKGRAYIQASKRIEELVQRGRELLECANEDMNGRFDGCGEFIGDGHDVLDLAGRLVELADGLKEVIDGIDRQWAWLQDESEWGFDAERDKRFDAA